MNGRLVLLLAVSLAAQSVAADDVVNANVAEGAQQRSLYNPLRLGTRINLDPNIKTVSQAAAWVLAPTDYTVATQYPAPMEALRIAQSPVSPLAQTVKFMAIEEALLLIIGSENRLVVDHTHQLVSFEPIPKQDHQP